MWYLHRFHIYNTQKHDLTVHLHCISNLVIFVLDAGEDFDITGNLDIVFMEGSVNGDTGCVNIPILEDPDFEGDHTFQVEVGSVSPSIVDPPNLVAVTIMDDGGKMLWSFVTPLPPFFSPPLSFSQDAMVRLSSAMYTGDEGDLAFMDVCVVASLTSGGTLQIPLVVDLMATPGTASKLA